MVTSGEWSVLPLVKYTDPGTVLSESLPRSPGPPADGVLAGRRRATLVSAVWSMLARVEVRLAGTSSDPAPAFPQRTVREV